MLSFLCQINTKTDKCVITQKKAHIIYMRVFLYEKREKEEVQMAYVTYENLVQIGLFLVTLVGLVYKICKDKK